MNFANILRVLRLSSRIPAYNDLRSRKQIYLLRDDGYLMVGRWNHWDFQGPPTPLAIRFPYHSHNNPQDMQKGGPMSWHGSPQSITLDESSQLLAPTNGSVGTCPIGIRDFHDPFLCFFGWDPRTLNHGRKILFILRVEPKKSTNHTHPKSKKKHYYTLLKWGSVFFWGGEGGRWWTKSFPGKHSVP